MRAFGDLRFGNVFSCATHICAEEYICARVLGVSGLGGCPRHVCGFSSAMVDAQQGNTALIAAAFSGKAVFLRMLLDAGANKEAKNQVCRCEYVYCMMPVCF